MEPACVEGCLRIHAACSAPCMEAPGLPGTLESAFDSHSCPLQRSGGNDMYCPVLVQEAAAPPEDKVAAVSKALREALQSVDAAAYLRALVMSHSALGDLHGALRLIKDAKEAALAAGAEASSAGRGALRALMQS